MGSSQTHNAGDPVLHSELQRERETERESEIETKRETERETERETGRDRERDRESLDHVNLCYTRKQAANPLHVSRLKSHTLLGA